LFDPKRGRLRPYTQYNQFPELAQAHILHIAPDRQGTLWLCATTGLYTIHPQKGITARYGSGGRNGFYLPAEGFQHFYQDPQGIYWLATANAGLIRWDRGKSRYRQFRRSEGLSNDNIYAVYPDEHGHLWMSSDYGIMQFDPTRLTTRSYFVEDGITHNEFNRIAHFQAPNGRIYFGGLNGITAFDPRDFQAQQPPAELPLCITSFRQYSNSAAKMVDKTADVVAHHTISIEPEDRSSVLDFALLNYANAEKNEYAYQFKDMDKDWTYQAEPTLRLSNLPYGEHQLLIKAQAANGQWSANTLTIQLVVVRPLYLRSWFLILITLLAAGGIWAWLRWRIWRHRVAQLRLETQVRQATARIEEAKEIMEQQAQDLLRLNEARSHFFANISHEFRTPLTVILGMAAELAAYRPEPQPPAPVVQKAADLIERSGTNLLRLVNQILDLSKIEAGELHLHPTRADLVSLIRYVGDSFQSLAQARGIQLHLLLVDETCEADFDREKLQDILSNLLANALKFTPEGGHIYYQLRLQDGWQPLSAAGYYEELTPTSYLDGPWLQFSVSDTGPGISAGSLPRIFDRFYQADDQVASPGSGTGIGLALVRELVLLMQGGLAVRSRPGQGAEFVVSIRHTRQAPPAAELVRAPAPASLPPPERGGEPEPLPAAAPVLLLAEDNDDVAAYIQTCLGGEYRIMRAENGQQGIDLALEHLPDLILSDVMMPVKDGFELCDTLKGNERTSHIPIVLLTARAAVSDRLAGLQRGADAYLVKPFLREELRLVLSNLAQSRRALHLHYTQLALGHDPAAIPTPPAPPESSLEDAFLVKLRGTVEGQLDNPALSVDTICQLMGLSRTTLHKKLTALTGMSISRYLRALRLRRAQQLLATSELNVAGVAYAVGFEDPKYFSRVFSEEFGASPGEYRQSAPK
jgi:signal transduction histidine kinase/DNA-binding response OmpR family regulator